MKKLLSWGICLLVLGIYSSSWSGEVEEREKIGKLAVDAFYQEKFQLLEYMAEKYRSDRERTESGLWKLSLFYTGFYGALEDDVSNESSWIALEEKIKRWTSLFPNSPTPYIFQSIALQKRAWSIRGSGYANTVQENAWKPFRETMQLARSLLLEHKDVASRDPAWYENIIDISLTLNDPAGDMFDLFQEGVTREPLYYPTYFSLTNAVTPKWGGSKEDIEALANFAVENTRDTEGTSMYARIYWVAAGNQYGPQGIFTKSDASWEKMKKGFQDMMLVYPGSFWNLNAFALFSCAAGDYATTRKLIEEIGPNVVYAAWQREEAYGVCKRISEQAL